MFLAAQDALAALVLGFAGSTHCFVMCGPVVASYAAPGARSGGLARLELGYHSGRLLSYALLGGVFGALGAAVDGLGVHNGIPALAALLGGLVMVVVGLRQLLPVATRARWDARLRLSGMGEAITKTATAALTRGGGVATFALGSFTAMFPCGLLFAAYSKAASTAHPASAALFMMVFALSSAPALLLVSRVFRGVAGARGRLQLFAALSVLVLGLITAGSALVKLAPTMTGEGAQPAVCPHCGPRQP